MNTRGKLLIALSLGIITLGIGGDIYSASLFGVDLKNVYDKFFAKVLVRRDAGETIQNVVDTVQSGQTSSTTTTTTTAPETSGETLSVQTNNTTSTSSSNNSLLNNLQQTVQTILSGETTTSQTTTTTPTTTTPTTSTTPETSRSTQPASTIINGQGIIDSTKTKIQETTETVSEIFNSLKSSERQCLQGRLINKIKNLQSDDRLNTIITYESANSNIAKIDQIVTDYLNEKGLPFRDFKIISGKSIRQIKASQIKEMLQKLIENKMLESEEQAASSSTDVESVESSVPFDNDCPLYLEVDEVLRTKLDGSVAYIKAPDVHTKLGITGKGIKVAVLDTGVNLYHEGLKDAVLDSFDLTGEGAIDQNGHGTHVACIIGCRGNYYLGNAPDAQILNVKTTNKNGEGNMSDAISGLEWALDKGARVSNISLGALVDRCDGSDALNRAVDAANDQGMLVVVAAGNFGPGQSTIATPGCSKKALTVGAVNEQGIIADFSSRGPTADNRIKPNIFAPGVEIASAWYDNADSYVMIDGTSQASPHVAGVAALVLEANPSLNPEQIKQILTSNADPLGQQYSDIGSAGIINAYKVVSLYASEKASAPPTPTETSASNNDGNQNTETENTSGTNENSTVTVQESDVVIENAAPDETYQIEDLSEEVSSLDQALENLDDCLLQAGSNTDLRSTCSKTFIDTQIKFRKTEIPENDQKLNQNIEETAISLGKVSNILKDTAKNRLREIAVTLGKTVFIGQAAQTVESKTHEIIEKINQKAVTEKDISAFAAEIQTQTENNAKEKYKLNLIPFFDVDDNKWHFPFIQKVKSLGIASGYKDQNGNLRGDFGPGNLTTVAEGLKMVLESSEKGKSDSNREPKNTKVKDHWAEAYFLRAEELNLNIVKNTADDPNRPITREEFVQLQLEVFNIPPLTSFNPIFSDVDKNSYYAGYIYKAYQEKIASGDAGKDTFRPKDKINRAEISKVIINSIQKFK